MATLNKSILPIPESVVVGTGSYTVPANKYGFLYGSCTASIGMTGNNYQSSASASAVSINQWITAGTTIATSTSAPAGTYSGASNAQIAVASININGTSVCVSRALENFYSTSAGSAGYSSTAVVGWALAVYPIPINNLPASLIT